MAALVKMADLEDFDDLTLPKKAAKITVDQEVDAEKLAEFYRATPLIEAAIKAVRAEVERRTFAGEMPGFKVVEGKKGNRAWADEEKAAVELTKSGRLSAAEAYSKTPISPTQAEKLLKDRPKIWSKIAPLITQSPGSPSVVTEDDPRPALQLASEPDDFADLTALPPSESDAPALSIEDLMA
jgi:hypothetical protein